MIGEEEDFGHTELAEGVEENEEDMASEAKDGVGEAEDSVGEAEDSVGEAEGGAGEAEGGASEAEDDVGEAKDGASEAKDGNSSDEQLSDDDPFAAINRDDGGSAVPIKGLGSELHVWNDMEGELAHGGEEAIEEEVEDGRRDMEMSRLDEVPNTGEVAEIVLLSTSLGGVRRRFFASKRAQHFLDCKSVVYYLVDTNYDVSVAEELLNVELFKQWRENNILMMKENVKGIEGTDADVIIPQVLVDGIPVGDEVAMQDLEDDGDLDWIFSRAACPSCLQEKSPDSASCESCGVVFKNIVPFDVVESGGVHQFYQGALFNKAEAAPPCFKSPSSYGCQSTIHEYEEVFGEEAPE